MQICEKSARTPLVKGRPLKKGKPLGKGRQSFEKGNPLRKGFHLACFWSQAAAKGVK